MLNTGPTSEHFRHLSQRETEVLQMVSAGMTNSQIARELALSTHAVKFHLASVYRKLGVGNRTEAAVAYLRTSSLTHD